MKRVPFTRARPPRPLPPPRLVFTERHPAGIRFTERMRGWWSDAAEAPWSLHDPMKRRHYEDAFERGRRAGRSLELVLTIATRDLEWTLRDRKHRFRFAGSATVAGLPGGPDGGQTLMARGRFELFVPLRDEISTSQMRYEAELATVDGQAWRFTGFKSVRQGGGVGGFGEDEDRPGLWRDQTRLYFRLWQPTGERVPPLKLGIATLSVSDFVRQLLTIRATGTSSAVEAYDTVARFLVFFSGVLRDTYGGPLASSRYAPPNWWDRTKRRLQARQRLQERGPAPTTTTLSPHTEDGVELRLTRYRHENGEPRNGPVILAPGFGVRAASFAIDTVDINLVEFLCANDYDVWLLDYRASPELAASAGDFSIDHIARYDWPTAIATVRRETGAPVRVIAHCVGAMSFTMAALGEHLDPASIRSAILSQVATHPHGVPLNELKALARLGFWLQLFGAQSLRITIHAADTYRRPLLDRLLKYYPTRDACDNPVCRRVRFAFGESYRHANLNRETHDAIIEMFGNPAARADELKAAYASLRALRHLALMLREREIVHEDRRPYLRDGPLDDVLPYPICLLSGARNELFPPDGIERTRAYLDQRLRRATDVLRLEGYAHMDCFIGARARVDVFPRLLERLQQT
jgi:cholesterol oxidase